VHNQWGAVNRIADNHGLKAPSLLARAVSIGQPGLKRSSAEELERWLRVGRRKLSSKPAVEIDRREPEALERSHGCWMMAAFTCMINNPAETAVRRHCRRQPSVAPMPAVTVYP